MKKLLVFLPLVLFLGMASCGSAAQKQASNSGPGSAPRPPMTTAPAPTTRAAPPPPVIMTQTPSSGGVTYGAESDTADGGQMIVRNGNIQIVVDNVSQAIDQVTRLASSFGGYVVSSKQSKNGEKLTANISVRVAEASFDDAMRALRGMASEVISESTSSSDVTQEYVDLSSRLKNLQAAETQLVTIMGKAEKIEDVLAVQRELTNTRGEIEQTQGRMQYLEKTSAMSLINVQLEETGLDISLNASKTSMKYGEKVQFTGKLSGGFAPYSCVWDFGDGETSTTMNPSHTYNRPGTYTVSMRVTDDRNTVTTEVREGYITVLSAWNAGSVVNSAWNGLVTFGRVLASIGIWLGIFSPVWLAVVGVVYWRRSKRKKQ